MKKDDNPSSVMAEGCHQEHLGLISSAYMAPAIVGEWQKKAHLP